MNAREREQRRATMAKRYLAGDTLEEIGDSYGLTRERVRQILKPLGLCVKQALRSQIDRRGGSFEEKRAKWRDAYWLEKYGLTAAEHKQVLRVEGRPTLRFTEQRNNALARGIEWNVMLCDWWNLWKDVWHLRGRSGEKLVMTRKDLSRGFHVDNLLITTHSDCTRRTREWEKTR